MEHSLVGLTITGGADNLKVYLKSRYLNKSVGMWSDEGTLHIVESGYSLCGCRVDKSKGWFDENWSERNITLRNFDQSNNQKPSDTKYCKKCSKALKKRLECR